MILEAPVSFAFTNAQIVMGVMAYLTPLIAFIIMTKVELATLKTKLGDLKDEVHGVKTGTEAKIKEVRDESKEAIGKLETRIGTLSLTLEGWNQNITKSLYDLNSKATETRTLVKVMARLENDREERT